MEDSKGVLYGPASTLMRDVNDLPSPTQSESDSAEEDQNGSRKRRRPMNVT